MNAPLHASHDQVRYQPLPQYAIKLETVAMSIHVNNPSVSKQRARSVIPKHVGHFEGM